MTSLDVGDDDFAETLKGGQWFDADRFPDARFVSTAISVTGENTGLMAGELTMLGETAPIRLNVVFNGGANDRLRGGDYIVGFSAKGEIDRTAFGVDRFSGLISDTVFVEIEAEFVREND
jgi:polyisoprenoid-binding protein YceI